MANDEDWGPATRRRLEFLAESETDAPGWLRDVLRRLAAAPERFRLAEEPPEPAVGTFIYFH